MLRLIILLSLGSLLLGCRHEQGVMCNQAFIDEWQGKIYEVIDTYSPDFIWFDFALDSLPEGYVKDFLAYYYNHAVKNNKEVVVTYKDNDIIPGAAVRDLELGQEPKITYHEWITDSTVDDRGAWGYANDLTFKTPDRVCHPFDPHGWLEGDTYYAVLVTSRLMKYRQ